ncbi:C-GCAxxG-C-C family protein [Hespellia stercorisuis]|uniref:C_GCAxxG_C_C family probable redox protein n=1 Tax=Hespellia stercorisuis DSM 15480 TaxID=1121950 RepID=A0A1M6JGD0_9FIRM|nr:C-GCAxxG-C-C family protein [Hespellia stercorisuis]SHJ45632.1 C_GCAxxG_C_C family probable redox protein [Hespellia stercorisuis DSM 15480]
MTIDIENSVRAQEAMNLFLEGYNCAQAVTLAFQDMYEADPQTMVRMSSSFGAGMGRLREVCGAVSGMFIVAGLLYGYDDPKAKEEKKKHYERIQELAGSMTRENGSIVCRELLGLGKGKDVPTPEERSPEYYKKRPCRELIGMAAAVMEQYIRENPPE